MTIATGRPKGKPRKLTPEQHRELAARHFKYLQLRVAAAQHSPYALARDFDISESTVNAYLQRKPV